MPHVVTQPCCSDASCAYACPVNCIHPTPDEPDFLTAEMLHIDPAACVDCGACVPACPVDAIVPQRKLTTAQLPFVEINREFYRGRTQPRPLLAPVIPPPVAHRPGRLRVAIVGSGPAAMYAADELLTLADVEVDIYERLSEPYGLARFGVAPDHLHTRQVATLFGVITSQDDIRMHLNTEVGKDISLDELRATHDAVLYATGAATDRKLGIPGEHLPGVTSATDFVAWYNGHPDYTDARYDLSAERAVIVGNGNVALDVARILTIDPARLADTTIAPAALHALRESNIREVVVAGRRGPAQSAGTVPELAGLLDAVDVRADAQPADLEIRPGQAHSVREKLRLLRSVAARPARPDRQVTLRYLLSPTRIIGENQVTAIEFARNVLQEDAHGRLTAVPSATTETVSTGLVLSSIGYRAQPITGLPFDDQRAVVPNEQGRVEPGLYVAGWIKRGPSGFIGTNKSCAQETVRALVDDFNQGVL